MICPSFGPQHIRGYSPSAKALACHLGKFTPATYVCQPDPCPVHEVSNRLGSGCESKPHPAIIPSGSSCRTQCQAGSLCLLCAFAVYRCARVCGSVQVCDRCLLVFACVCLSVCLSVCRSVRPSVCLSVGLSVLSVCPSVRPSVRRSVGRSVGRCVCVSGWLAGWLAGWLSVCLFVCLSVCLSVSVCQRASQPAFLCVCPSTCLPDCLSVSICLSFFICLSLSVSICLCLSVSVSVCYLALPFFWFVKSWAAIQAYRAVCRS